MNPVGGDQVNITNHPADDGFPSWSPDGTRIAFASDREGNFDIYVMGSDGSGQVRLTSDPADDVFPAWSPDGTAIAFETERDGNTEVYVMGSDGSNPINLTNHPTPMAPPPGHRMGHRSPSTRCATAISTSGVGPDGSDPGNVTDTRIDDFFPTWAPDGRQLSFSSNRDGNAEVYVIGLGGSGRK